MRKNLYRNCVLGSRDIGIFSFLNQFKAMTLEQIWAAFFKGIGTDLDLWDYLFLKRRGRRDGSLSAAYQRMEKLAQFGYLEAGETSENRRIYRLERAGHAHLLAAGQGDFRKPPAWPKKGEMEHSLLLSAIGFVFARMGLTPVSERRWMSYDRREIMAGRLKPYELLPVADMHVRYAGAWRRIELELSRKSREGYVSRWKRLGSCMNDSDPYVLYITADAGLKRTILEHARQRYYPAIYAATLEEFRIQGATLWEIGGVLWTNFEGQEFRLDHQTQEVYIAAKGEKPTLHGHWRARGISWNTEVDAIPMGVPAQSPLLQVRESASVPKGGN